MSRRGRVIVLVCCVCALGLLQWWMSQRAQAVSRDAGQVSPTPSSTPDFSPESFRGGAPLDPDPKFCAALGLLIEYEHERRAEQKAFLAAGSEGKPPDDSRSKALLVKASAAMDEADLDPPQRDRNVFARRIIRAYCDRQMQQTPKNQLSAMEKVAYGYAFGSHTDPERFLAYSLECYKRDPYENQSFHHITKGFFTDVRRTWMEQHFAEICPPLKGKTVADVHCSLGEELPWMLAQVGPTGTVWAESLSSDTFDFIDYASKRGYPQMGQIRRRLGDRSDIKLPARSVDVIFLLQALHDLAFVPDLTPGDLKVRNAWLASVRRALRPGGVLIIVEDGRHNPMPQCKKLLAMGGFEIERIIEVPDYSPGPPTKGFVLRARMK